MSNISTESMPTAPAAQPTFADSVEQAQRLSATETTSICSLNDLSIFSVTGADAKAFLQGQFCNDIAAVTDTQAQITGYCTPKGRLLALPTVVGYDSGYRLIVPSDTAAAFIKRLSMFVMRSDVKIEPLTDWQAIGIIGGAPTSGEDTVMDAIAAVVGALPTGALSVSTDDKSQLIRWHDDLRAAGGARARYLRIADRTEQQTLWELTALEGRYSASAWRLGDVSAGVPSIRGGTTDTFIPQMINLQLIDALSFTKGCYPGQEIVARMQYLGKLKRHMQVFSVDVDLASADGQETLESLMQPGQALGCGTDENAGVLVDAQPQSATRVLVLAVTKVNAPDEPFTLGTYPLKPCAMPYALPSLENALESCP